MVTLKLQPTFLKVFLFVSLFACQIFAQVPSAEEIAGGANEIRTRLEALNENLDAGRLALLQESANKFKAMVAQAEQAVDYERGGAATPKATAAVSLIGDFGADIALALSAFQLEHAEELSEKGLDTTFEDIMVNELRFPLLKLAFKLMRYGVDEKSNVDGRVSVSDVVTRAIRNVVRDLALVFFPLRQNRTTREWSLRAVENARREQAIRELIPKYQRIAEAEIPEYNRLYDGDLDYEKENHEERLAGLMLWLSDRAVNIRVERFSAEKYAAIAYAVTGTVISQSYLLNFAGNSYSAHLETSAVILFATAVITLAKVEASSIRSTSEWIEFSRYLRGKMSAGLIKSSEIHLAKSFPTEYHPAQVPHWVERRVWIRETFNAWKSSGAAMMRNATAIIPKIYSAGVAKAAEAEAALRGSGYSSSGSVGRCAAAFRHSDNKSPHSLGGARRN